MSGFCKAAGATEGELATVEMSICGKKVIREVAAVKRESIHWVAALNTSPSSREHRFFYNIMGEWRQTWYIPPSNSKGTHKGAVWPLVGSVQGQDSEENGHSIAESEQPEQSSIVVSRVVTMSRSTKAEIKVVEGEIAVGEQAVDFGSSENVSSVLEEESDGLREGCAEMEETKDIVLNSEVSITKSSDSNQSGNEPAQMSEKVLETELLNKPSSSRQQLIEETKTCETLKHLRELANRDVYGYCWRDSLLFRYRLDDLGQSVRQLCLPKSFRKKCYKLAHESFGHRGK